MSEVERCRFCSEHAVLGWTPHGSDQVVYLCGAAVSEIVNFARAAGLNPSRPALTLLEREPPVGRPAGREIER
jgi:hypothetical protein